MSVRVTGDDLINGCLVSHYMWNAKESSLYIMAMSVEYRTKSEAGNSEIFT